MKSKSVASDKQARKQIQKQIIISPSQFGCQKDSMGLLANRVDGRAYESPVGDQERGREVGKSGKREQDFDRTMNCIQINKI